MLIIKQKWIARTDLQANPDVLYLFGDNLLRQGWGGQAAEMRDEPNSCGIATKRYPYTTTNSYFYDADPDVFNIIDEEFKKVVAMFSAGRFKAIVVPSSGLGTGLSNLQSTAPTLLKYIEDKVESLKNI